jgi:hypothetical protein
LDYPLEHFDNPLWPARILFVILENVNRGTLVVEIGAAWLEKTSDKEKLEELFRVFEELEGETGLNELCDERVGRRWRREEGEV